MSGWPVLFIPWRKFRVNATLTSVLTDWPIVLFCRLLWKWLLLGPLYRRRCHHRRYLWCWQCESSFKSHGCQLSTDQYLQWNSTCGGDFPGCCSSSGWCGQSDTYCGSGHQSAYDTPSPSIASITSLTGAGVGQPTGVYTTVIPVSSCLPFADPDAGNDGSCQCSGYTGKIPIKTGSKICDYTAYTETVTPTTAPPR